jgi:hypothetical protein
MEFSLGTIQNEFLELDIVVVNWGFAFNVLRYCNNLTV